MKTIKQIIGIIFLGITMLSIPVLTKAQSEAKPIGNVHKEKGAHIFLNAGVGVGGFHHVNDKSYGIELGIINKKNIIMLRNFKAFGVAGADSNLFFVDAEPNEKISDYGILLGRVIDGGSIVFSASAGIAYTTGMARGKFLYSSRTGSGGNGSGFFSNSSSRIDHYEHITIQTIGMPIEVEMLLGARHNCNFSITAYANINPKYSFGGLLFCLRLGAAKNKSR